MDGTIENRTPNGDADAAEPKSGISNSWRCVISRNDPGCDSGPWDSVRAAADDGDDFDNGNDNDGGVMVVLKYPFVKDIVSTSLSS